MKRNVYFFISMFAIGVCAIVAHSFFSQSTVVFAGDGSTSSPWTVCTAGCDFTTISSALASSSIGAGDVIQIEFGYSTTSADAVLTLADTNLTIQCAENSTVIGQGSQSSTRWNMTSGATLQNCLLENPDIQIDKGTDVTITSNTLRTTEVQHSTIFTSRSRNVVVTNNSFTYNDADGCGLGYNAVYFYKSSSTLFASNTVSVAAGGGCGLAGSFLGVATFDGVYTQGEIVGNVFYFNALDSAHGILVSNNGGPVDVVVRNNSFFLADHNGSGSVYVQTRAPYAFSVTSTYNLFYSSTSSDGGFGYGHYYEGSSLTSSLYYAYNGVYGMDGVTVSTLSASSSPVDGGGNITSNPYPRLENVATEDDYFLNPMSNYLDVTGTLDIGAYRAARATTGTIDADCTFTDYENTCLATSTSFIPQVVEGGDAFLIAAGTYAPFALTSVDDVTIRGIESGVIFAGNTSTSYALQLNDAAGTVVENVVLQDATELLSSYTANPMIFSFGGNDYTQSSGFGASSDNQTAFFNAANCSSGFTFVGSAGTDVSDIVGMGEGNFHIGLTTFGANRVSVLVSDTLFADAAEVLAADCGGFGVTIEAFVEDAFVLTGDSYTYDSAAVATASVGVVSAGTPAIVYSELSSAGISLFDSSSNTIRNVTSTGNYYGVLFSGISNSNQVDNSTIQSSLSHDVFASTTAQNTFEDVVFTRTSSTIQDGSVVVSYRPRVFVQSTSSIPLGGVGVSLTSADLSQSATGTTMGDGYTQYLAALTAYELTTSSVSLTSGGFNPYTITASASSTYMSTTTVEQLSSPEQTIMLTMYQGSGGPIAPSSLTTTLVSTSSMLFSWTDNSSDETSFTFDYVASTSLAAFPGTSSSLAANTTSTLITGLTANTAYYARVRAENGTGNSAYVTSSLIVTRVPAPTTVTATLLTDTSVRVTWTDMDATQYKLYQDEVLINSTSLTSSTITGLTCETVYTFGVRSVNQLAALSLTTTTDAITTGDCPEVSSGGGGGSTFIRIFEAKNSTSQFGSDPTESSESDSTDEDDATKESCPLPTGTAAKSPASNAVYYITTKCTKRAFSSAPKYFTYFTTWNDVVVTTQSTLDSIPNDTLGFMPWGPLYKLASGTLIKTPSDPKTYLLLEGTLYHIENEAAAAFQFGPSWATWIEDVDAGLLENYPLSETQLDTTTRPDGMLIKYTDDPKVYQLDTEDGTQVKRWIPDEATFQALNFRDDRIVTIPDSETYPDGTDLTL